MALLVAAAAALGSSAALTWARQPFAVPLRGSVDVEVDGATVAPALGPLALLALAAVAGTLATAGWWRRVLGVVLLATAVLPVAAVSATPDVTAAPDLPARAEPGGPVTLLVAGPVTAALGAVFLAAAGVLLAAAGHRMPRLGARYRAPAAARTGPAPDRERRLWDSLDAGDDPTTEPPR